MSFYPNITKATSSSEVVHLVNNALSIIDINYSNYQSKDYKTYHNISHTIEVINTALNIFNSLDDRVNERLKDLLLIAAAYHDIVYVVDDPDNESNSSKFITDFLRRNSEFNSSDLKMIADCINSTAIYFDIDKGILHKHEPSSIIARVLADADLSTFGAPTIFYWPKAYLLYKERLNLVRDDSFYTFMKYQKIKLENLHYFLEQTNSLFPNLRNNLVFVSKYLATLKK